MPDRKLKGFHYVDEKIDDPYATLTNEDFDRILIDEILPRYTMHELISVPGVYEILSEQFNNEVLDYWIDNLRHED